MRRRPTLFSKAKSVSRRNRTKPGSERFVCSSLLKLCVPISPVSSHEFAFFLFFPGAFLPQSMRFAPRFSFRPPIFSRHGSRSTKRRGVPTQYEAVRSTPGRNTLLCTVRRPMGSGRTDITCGLHVVCTAAFFFLSLRPTHTVRVLLTEASVTVVCRDGFHRPAWPAAVGAHLAGRVGGSGV